MAIRRRSRLDSFSSKPCQFFIEQLSAESCGVFSGTLAGKYDLEMEKTIDLPG